METRFFKFKKPSRLLESIEIKNKIIEGTASESLLKRFHEKVLHLGTEEALHQCILEIYDRKKWEKSFLKKAGLSLTSLILILFGFLFYFGKTKIISGHFLMKVPGHKRPTPLFAELPSKKKPVIIPSLLPDPLNFCGEPVPMKDKKTFRKLKVAIYQTRYTHLESKKLRERVKKWFPVITPILKKYQIPDDFKYIPLVETGFENTQSQRGARGFWQLMEGTARQYGLEVTDSTDERLDVRRSTIAACRYIRDLHRQLKSWTLTAAAYNMGPGGLQNKVDVQNIRDYYQLKLSPETSKYIFKTLAFKQMLRPRHKKTDPYSG